MQGSARAPEKFDLEEEYEVEDYGCTWLNCVSKTLKPLVYIGGGEGLALGLKGAPRAPTEVERSTPTPIRFGEGGVLLQSYLE